MKVALITGGSRGIGRACALRLAQDGMKVVIAYRNNVAEAESLLKEIDEIKGAEAKAVQADISREEDVRSLFENVLKDFGGLDVVVNAAGVLALETIEKFSVEDFDRLFAVNVRGHFLVNQQAARHINKGGAIINFSSTVTRSLRPEYGPYAATKGAVDAMTMVLAREMRGRDVTVNAVAPGPVATSMFLDGKSDELVRQLAAMCPMERLGDVEDIAGVVAFLAGAEGRWVNGQTVYANGGMM